MASNEASQQANRSGIDPKRLVVIFYLLAGLVLAQFLEHVLGSLWERLSLPRLEVVEGWSTPTLLGFALAAAVAITAYLHPRTHQLSLEVASELMRVTWPSWDETRA